MRFCHREAKSPKPELGPGALRSRRPASAGRPDDAGSWPTRRAAPARAIGLLLSSLATSGVELLARSLISVLPIGRIMSPSRMPARAAAPSARLDLHAALELQLLLLRVGEVAHRQAQRLRRPAAPSGFALLRRALRRRLLRLELGDGDREVARAAAAEHLQRRAGCPAWCRRPCAAGRSTSSIALPSNLVMMSPASTPALSAGSRSRRCAPARRCGLPRPIDSATSLRHLVDLHADAAARRRGRRAQLLGDADAPRRSGSRTRCP